MWGVREGKVSAVKTFGLWVTLFLLTAVVARAEESSLEFFDRDAALTVFDDSVVVVNAGRIKEKKAEKESPREKKDGPTETKAKDGGSPFDPKNTSPEDIVAEFGEPEDKLPVIAVESAPKPFKAMMRALEAGHDDLAFQYARQYVRYIGHVQSQNARLMSMTGKALEREGMAEPGTWKGGPDFVEDREILERDLARSGIAAQSAELDARTREVFEDAKRAEMKLDPRNQPGGENSIVPSVHDDPKTQALINGEGGAQLPPGAPPFDVFFFFAPQDKTSLAMAPEVESLYRSGRKMNFMGFTVGPAVPGEVQRYKSTTRTTFPIQNGSRLAATMKLDATPAIVIVDNRTGQTVSRSGVVPYEELKRIFISLEQRSMPGRPQN